MLILNFLKNFEKYQLLSVVEIYFNKSSSNAVIKKEEKGSIIIFLAILLGVLFGILAMVVDQGKEELFSLQLQALADSAAHAGVISLNGTA